MSAPVTAERFEVSAPAAVLAAQYDLDHAEAGRMEDAYYFTLRNLSPEYRGGLCWWWRLSNGGLFLSPRRRRFLNVRIYSQNFEARLHPDSCGLVATTYLLRRYALRFPDNPRFDRERARLVAYAHLLPNKRKIFQALGEPLCT